VPQEAPGSGIWGILALPIGLSSTETFMITSTLTSFSNDSLPRLWVCRETFWKTADENSRKSKSLKPR